MSTFRRLADTTGAPYLQIDHLRLIQSPEYLEIAADRFAAVAKSRVTP
jgi:hypothetical protein